MKKSSFVVLLVLALGVCGCQGRSAAARCGVRAGVAVVRGFSISSVVAGSAAAGIRPQAEALKAPPEPNYLNAQKQ